MHITQHYPKVIGKHESGADIGQVDFDSVMGVATVPHNGIDEDWETV
jgi:hypothetical protein